MPMKVSPARLAGVLLIEPDVFGDERGYFLETWSQERYASAACPARSCRTTSRARAAARCAACTSSSRTPRASWSTSSTARCSTWPSTCASARPPSGEWVGGRLSADNHRQLYIPAGFAHGFCVRSESALFAYKCTEVYHPETEIGIAWNDPDLAIIWPADSPKLSAKDSRFPRLSAIDPVRLPRWEEQPRATTR